MYRGLEIKLSVIVFDSHPPRVEEVIVTEADILKLADEKAVTSYSGARPKCYPMIEEIEEGSK